MTLARHFISRCSQFLLIFALLAIQARAATSLRFEVGLEKNFTSAVAGRLLVILSQNTNHEPRFGLLANGPNPPFVLGRDVTNFVPGKTALVDQHVITFPENLSQLPAGEYFAQALLISNIDLRMPNAPGNLYSDARKIHLDPARGGKIELKLSHEIPAEQLPPDTELVKFLKIQSPLLSKFHGRPIYLRAGIILPRDYASAPNRKYPLWVRIGGSNTRYTSILGTMNEKSPFRSMWVADDTPRMIMLQLDGAGPYGDPYQVNSANNGPYGDAVTQELIPLVEKKFRSIGEPRARVLSGGSTGGWVSLALQVFYPDFFNGTWTYYPDGVDFRAFELVNIYEDENTYVNKYGCERPSERALNGDVRLYMRQEAGLENILGPGDSFTMSGKDWGAWNAVYGPRGADGRPAALWNPLTGKIDHSIAEQWKKYDLRMVMEENWKTLGPKLQGKLHIATGEADDYFLNNAIHLLDAFLSQADPPYQGRIVYGPGKGHGWTDITASQMMHEMETATGGPRN